MGWSPDQIAGRMEREEKDYALSAESIYRHAYSPVGRRAGLPRLLAQRKPKRGRRANGRREPAIPTERRSTSGRQKPICAASSAIGRAI
jgi:IS30 family transposase